MVLCRRKILGMLFLLCCLLGNVNVQARPVRKKVGLVLGGGGAKGAAEVGVLKVLEEADIPIDYIVGTSIGGIVGGLYSIGYDAADIDSLFRNQNWLFLLSDQAKRESESFLSKDEKERYMIHLPLSRERKVSLPTGYLKGQNILNLFSKLTVGYHHVDDFSTLPMRSCGPGGRQGGGVVVGFAANGYACHDVYTRCVRSGRVEWHDAGRWWSPQQSTR